ncbi:hypothetical protein B0J11DRAFT_187108 [Dendryphion nanum]|uniref:Uncharacterized protein n=1 Tax=Dendryphion nanum TaxID=256645 RepID=A0A9P9D3T5_9PLEO|nr:hypothetical protein B0J11DRAFT_187108 [Dendryphion nanum]
MNTNSARSHRHLNREIFHVPTAYFVGCSAERSCFQPLWSECFFCNSILSDFDSRDARKQSQIRLANVHLESLPINHSWRPEQLSIVRILSRVADCGLVTGDSNPVIPEYDGNTASNRLVDAWAHLHLADPGYTWGVDRDEPFSPNSLDKLAIHNLTTFIMQGRSTLRLGAELGEAPLSRIKDSTSNSIPHSSTHFGLCCTFT